MMDKLVELLAELQAKIADLDVISVALRKYSLAMYGNISVFMNSGVTQLAETLQVPVIEEVLETDVYPIMRRCTYKGVVFYERAEQHGL